MKTLTKIACGMSLLSLLAIPTSALANNVPANGTPSSALAQHYQQLAVYTTTTTNVKHVRNCRMRTAKVCAKDNMGVKRCRWVKSCR